MALVREVVTDAKVEQEARLRMALILLELESSDEEQAITLRAEYDALEGSWQTERWVEMPVLSDAEAVAYTQAVAQQETNEKTIQQQAEQALASNTTYIALAAPTNAQVAAQVKALTRQNNKIIRLLLRKLDSTD